MWLWLFIATKLMPSQRTNFFVMAQKKNNNKNENVCGQVQKAHNDKSDKGFYFQDFKRLVCDSESDLKFSQSIGSSYSCSLSDSSK